MISTLVKDRDSYWELQWRGDDGGDWIVVVVLSREADALECFNEVAGKKGVAGQFRVMRVDIQQTKGSDDYARLRSEHRP